MGGKNLKVFGRILFIICSLVNISLSAQAEGHSWQRPLFTDESFQQLLIASEQSEHLVVLYSWSPHMVLSGVGVSQIHDLAQELGFDVQYVVDYQTNEALIDETAFSIEMLQAPQLASPILRRMDFAVHFPCLLLIHKGEIIGHVRPGYDEPDRLRRYLRSKQSQILRNKPSHIKKLNGGFQ